MPGGSAAKAALDAMDASGLRELIRDMLPWLDDATRARFVDALFDRAARNSSGWVPEGPADAMVEQIEAFAEAIKRNRYADPAEVDGYLREGSNAFLAKDYRGAFRIFRALLISVGQGEVDLGQDELIDEVLGVDPAACAAQYVVSMYMTATPKHRGRAVLSAIDEMQSIGHFWEPLRELERAAIEPFPDFDGFLAQWLRLVEERARRERDADWDRDVDRWLREAVGRTQGPEGLADLARASKRAEDLRAWCRALVEIGDWTAALVAYDEAAELVADKAHPRGDLLDGAALAAQQLGCEDLPARLERAWRATPTMVRLRRWLGSSKTREVLRRRVAVALDACPKRAHRQLALMHVLQRDFTVAAKLLAAAPGLGWSDSDHPGHLLFPLFARLLGGIEVVDVSVPDLDELRLSCCRSEPQLATPAVAVLLELVDVRGTSDEKTRAIVIEAMRKAAEKRIAGVTEKKRRRYYGHAASLALVCAQLDRTADGIRWFAGIRDEYRRYPALQRELDAGKHQR